MYITLSSHARVKWEKELNALAHKHFVHQSTDIENVGCIAKRYLDDLDLLKKALTTNEVYIIFSGLPQESVTPVVSQTGETPLGKSHISESVLLGLTEAIGFHPFAYLEERNGALIHDITPAPGKEHSISSDGIKAFPWHTDAAYLNRNIRPATLSLYCLNNQAGAGTRLASADDIIRQLSQHQTDILMTAQFRHHAPETFAVEHKYIIASVLDRVDGRYEMKLSSHNIEPLTAEAKSAFSALLSAMDRAAIIHQWRPGDMVIFNNSRCVHSRGDIEGERWLQRCYGSPTICAGSVLKADAYTLR